MTPSATLYQSKCQSRYISASSTLRKATTESDDPTAKATPVKRKRGRPRKDEAVKEAKEITKAKEKKSKTTSKPKSDNSKCAKKSTSKANPLPPRLFHPSPNHSDLKSFLAYADRTNANRNSNVYKGTLYEYTVADTLSRMNFKLLRTGRSNDLGIDLVGHFNLPGASTTGAVSKKNVFQEIRVLVQCKKLTATPAMVRELEGAYVGAPAGWRDEGVLALLVSNNLATLGVREAISRSRWPLGFMQVSEYATVGQFLWNFVATDIGLAGLGIIERYRGNDKNGKAIVTKHIGLTWMGELWKTGEDVK